MDSDESKPGVLYSIEWYIDGDNIAGYGIGKYELIRNFHGDILYLDFTSDGDIVTYRIDIQYITSVKEYTHDMVSNL